MFDFEQIYKEHFFDVYKYVLSISRDAAVAEEITQETFFKAMQNIDKFNGECKLYVWLCQIAKNTYFSFCRKRNRYDSSVDADIPSQEDIEMDYVDKDAAKQLHVLLHNLDEPYKEVFTLRVFGELPFSQIGELFEKTDSWARLIFYRAKKQLLPLYFDGVCSNDSKAAVDEHLAACENCKAELRAMQVSLPINNTEHNLKEAEAVRNLSHRLKKGKMKSILKSVLLTTLTIAAVLLVLYIFVDVRITF